MTRVIVNPTTGKMETAPDLPTPSLERARRELRDMIEGNTVFHQDAWSRPRPMGCYCEALMAGMLCVHCQEEAGDAAC